MNGVTLSFKDFTLLILLLQNLISDSFTALKEESHWQKRLRTKCFPNNTLKTYFLLLPLCVPPADTAPIL